MQTSKIKQVLKLRFLNKEFVRSVALASNGSHTKLEDLKSWREIPGPSTLPIIGQLHHYFGGELSTVMVDEKGLQKLFDRYGPIVRLNGVLGTEHLIFLGDPEIAAHVLRSENWLPIRPGFITLEYYRRDYKRSKGHKVDTTGLITDHGDLWKEFRSAVNPVMLQPKTIKLYCGALDEVAMDMIKRIKTDRDEKNMLRRQFDREMNLWALESIGTVALGCRLNCFNSTLAEDSPQIQLIQCIHDLFEIANELDFKPGFWKYFSTPMFKEAMKLYEHHETLTRHFLKQGMDNLKLNSGQKSEQEKGVLEKLLEINEEYAYIMASDMLFAGVDTAANTVIATLYLLATHQEKQDKLRGEIMSKSDRRPYLKACIKEVMRLKPIVSGNLRRTTKEYNFNGYGIPKDMNVVISHREMSLMEQHYPRAQEFIPERWIVEKNNPLYYGNAHPFVYGPFGFGVRSCIGRRIAELEIETILARFIENFKVEWFGPPPKVAQTSLNYIKGPFNFIINDVE